MRRHDFIGFSPQGHPLMGRWANDPAVEVSAEADSGPTVPAGLRGQNAYFMSIDGWGDEAEGAEATAPKYLVECPGCGRTSDGRHLTPQERRLLRKALCPACVGDDQLYAQEQYRYVWYQSRHAHAPDTPLRSYPDYPEPRSERLLDEIAASDAARRALKLSESNFLCERFGQFKGLMLLSFSVCTLFPTVARNVYALDYIAGVDRKTMTWVVTAICVGQVGGNPYYCLDRDLSQAELAAILNVWPQHLATEIRHSAKPGWRMLREGRYRVGVGKTSQFFYPSYIVAQVLLGFEMVERLWALCRTLDPQVCPQRT